MTYDRVKYIYFNWLLVIIEATYYSMYNYIITFFIIIFFLFLFYAFLVRLHESKHRFLIFSIVLDILLSYLVCFLTCCLKQWSLIRVQCLLHLKLCFGFYMKIIVWLILPFLYYILGIVVSLSFVKNPNGSEEWELPFFGMKKSAR